MDLVDTAAPAEPVPGSLVGRLFGTTAALRGWALAALLANCALIVTGAVVRLTGSGLGCETWPRCNDQSYVPKDATSYHPYIEFGNRLLTFVLMAVAVGLLVTAIRTRRAQRIVALCWVGFLGIPFQGVIGGITVLTHLNPYVVALHLLLSIVLIVLSVKVLQLARGTHHEPLATGDRRLVQLLFCLLMVAIWLGTVVTGSGPHAGDHGAHRTGLNIEHVAKIHAWTVWLAVAVDALLLWRLRNASPAARRMAALVMAAMLVQGAIGYAQYFLGLPVGLVACHMLGIGLVTTAVSWFFFATRRGLPG